MTEMYIECKKHGTQLIERMDITEDFNIIYAKCNCRLKYSHGYQLIEENKIHKESKYIDDHKGRMYQDGSREFEGIMLQDGSYI